MLSQDQDLIDDPTCVMGCFKISHNEAPETDELSTLCALHAEKLFVKVDGQETCGRVFVTLQHMVNCGWQKCFLKDKHF